MKISRKNFIKSSSLLFGGFLVGAHKSFADVLQEQGGFKVLRNNIGIFTESGGTIGWYITEDAAVVIDSQMPDSAKHFLKGFEERTFRKMDFLFNTHHHGDHTAGNYVLKSAAEKIVAHENCPKLQKKAYGEGEKASMQVYADTVFSDKWTKEVGKEKITAAYFGPAHTGGDIIIHFENANIAHVGDIVFNNVYPFIDQKGGGSIRQWIEYLEKAEKKYDSDTTFIFGHADSDEGVTGKKKDLTEMREYFSALMDFVGKEIKKGKPVDEIKSVSSIPGAKDLIQRWEGARAANIEAAFNELKS